MPVYVDDMQRQARVGRLNAVWSHLMADTPEELLVFARQLGLNTRWIQHAGTPLEHFDVTEPKRQMALRLGAVPIRYGHEGAALTKSKRLGVPFDLEQARVDIATRQAELATRGSVSTPTPHTGAS